MRVPAHAASLPRSVVAVLAIGLLLAGCASAPKPGRDGPPARAASSERDGPGSDVPADLAHVPDAEPRIEPIRPGGANKPYQVFGRDYVPVVRDAPFVQRGLASWYGRKFHGRRTSSGEPYDMYAMTAAHPTLPIPSYARIRNPANGREVVVRVNDRGPFHADRIVDLSYAAALRLDLLRGVAPVELERITFDEIRAGNWRRGDPGATRLASAVSPAATAPATRAATTRGAPVLAVTVPPSDVQPVGAMSADAPSMPASSESVTALTVPTPAAMAAAAAPPTPVMPAALAAVSPAASRGFWVQLGAFRESSGAESFQRRLGSDLDWLAPSLATVGDAALYRVQAGPYANREDAQAAASRVREAIGLVPVVVQR
jgi:rare lipoprotein A